MPAGFQSTLLLTVLLAIGLVFFLRAASKDRTTVVDVHSPQPALEVLSGLSDWLEQRGWIRDGGDADRQVLRFRGAVAASPPLAVLLSALAAIGATCFGLVLRQLAPQLSWWPLMLILLGPVAGVVYSRRAARTESILMSLPPLVRWEYGYAADAGSREALLTELFTKPQDWLGDASLEDRCRPHGAIN